MTKTKPAALARRRMGKQETSVDRTHLSPRQKEVHRASDGSVVDPTHAIQFVAGPGRRLIPERLIPAEASHRHTRVTAKSATVTAVCRCDGQNLGGST